MTTIAIFGGTGYAGGAIRDEALRRGHTVITVSRTEAEAAGKAGLIRGAATCTIRPWSITSRSRPRCWWWRSARPRRMGSASLT